jgi:Short C-terminal domain
MRAGRRGMGRPMVVPVRRGRPGLMGTMARTAVVAGTATAVAGGVSRPAAQNSAQEQHAAAYQQQQQQEAAQQQAMADQAGSQAAAQTAAQFQTTQAAAQPAAASPDDRMDKIKELGEMKSQGLLTEEEFTAEKARILGA